MSENRTHQRLQLTYPFSYHRQESKTPSYIVFENISEDGMKIHTETLLKKNECIHFNIKLLGSIIKGKGKIVWNKPSSDGKSHDAGVKFTKIGPTAKINLSKCLLELTRA